MTPTTLALARRVRALLEAPERWTQMALARTAEGELCEPTDSVAVCWCLLGAFDHVERGDDVGFIRFLEKELGGSVTRWNDAPGRTHADVLALLDRVIAEGER
jgi:hypothetical protein